MMANIYEIAKRQCSHVHDDGWEMVKNLGRWPDRYLEAGLERNMAEVLWIDYQRDHPELIVELDNGPEPTPLYAALSGHINEEYVVKAAYEIVKHARVCGAVARGGD
jgi:hypothetical protein